VKIQDLKQDGGWRVFIRGVKDCHVMNHTRWCRSSVV